MAQVLRGFRLGERTQVVARHHALGQLLEFRTGQQRAQLGLADQHDLQQLALVGLEIGQQAQLLEHAGRKVLRLVDDQHVVLPARVRIEQELVQRIEVVLGRGAAAAARGVGHMELVADRLQQLDRGELGVEDVGDVAMLGNLLEQAATDGGLAGADFAGQHHEAAATALHAVEQVRQRLAMALAHEQETGVRRDRERLVLQAEEGRVHGPGG